MTETTPSSRHCGRRQRFLNIEHERFGFGKPGRFDDDSLRGNFIDDLVHRRFEFAKQRATNTTATELSDPHVFAFNHFRIDRDLPELVHHNCNFIALLGENVTEQCGLPTAERTGDERDRGAKHFKNDELDETACRGLPALPLRLRSSFVGRARHAVRAARHSSFTSSFHIPDRRESHDGFADSRALGRSDNFIDVFVRWPSFLGETGP